MIVIVGAVLGAVIGLRNARKAQGDLKDRAQYATVGAIIGALLGLFATIGLEKLL
ncbi:MAG: hypothetical protein JJU07_10145 [Natronohydrobacter sp.]|nr:hypothetical protein [Natronohydrobacter sp.]